MFQEKSILITFFSLASYESYHDGPEEIDTNDTVASGDQHLDSAQTFGAAHDHVIFSSLGCDQNIVFAKLTFTASPHKLLLLCCS